MPEMVADLPWPSCYHLFLGPESNHFNCLIVISFDLARDARAVVQSGAVGQILTAARDNLYLNLAADLLQVQQTVIDHSISDCSSAGFVSWAPQAGVRGT